MFQFWRSNPKGKGPVLKTGSSRKRRVVSRSTSSAIYIIQFNLRKNMNEIYNNYSDAETAANLLFKAMNSNFYIYEVRKLSDYNHAKYIVSQEENLIVSADSVGTVVKVFRKG